MPAKYIKNAITVALFLLPSLLFADDDKQIDSLLQVLKTAKEDTHKVFILNNLAAKHVSRDPSKVIEFSKPALKLATKLGYVRGQARANNDLAIGTAIMGDYGKAHELFKVSLKLWESINDSDRIAATLDNIGNIYYYLADYNKALEIKLKSLKIKEQFSKKDQLASNYIGIANLLDIIGNHKKAISYYEIAESIAIEIGDDKLLGVVKSNLGIVYLTIKDYDLALFELEKALAIHERTKDKLSIPTTVNGIGQVYRRTGDPRGALEYFKWALDLNRDLGERSGVANQLNNIGGIYLDIENYPKAIRFLKEGLEIATEIGAREKIFEAHQHLARAYDLTGDIPRAHHHLKEFIALKDSIFNEERNLQFSEMEAKYQNEEKQKEIEVQALEIDKKNAEARHRDTQTIAFAAGFGLVLILGLVLLRGYRQKKKANELLGYQKAQIEEQNTEMKDSIRYAKRIQEAILPSPDIMQKYLKDGFVMYKPKDIVSGDFYWIEESDEKVLFAAVDCTGHGVPGAFMSIVGHTGLNQAVNEQNLSNPAQILESLNSSVNDTLRKREEEGNVRDGMDIALCSLDLKARKLEFAGAFNPLYRISNGELTEIKGTKQPIGQQQTKPFESHKIDLKEGDLIYIFSDGYADQFGGIKGKKFKYKQFKELLLSIADKPMNEQGTIIEERFEEWRGELEQIDDVCVIGVRV